MERPTVLKRFLRKPAFSDEGLELYQAIVMQGRLPFFYSDLAVPDTVDGRFDLITLHIFLTMRRLKREGAASEALGQDLTEIFFADMDLNLRELGASDIGVGRRVKRMIEGYYGRSVAYEAALDGEGDRLEEVLSRNLFGTTEASDAVLADLAAYVRAADGELAQQAWTRLAKGRIDFPEPRVGMAQHVG
ncbi:MAG: ubiquinol-cytochrome C chaperone family protein [Kiloniellales bacterium]